MENGLKLRPGAPDKQMGLRVGKIKVANVRELQTKTNKKPPGITGLILAAAGVFVFILIGSVWLYVSAVHSLREQAKAQGISLYVQGFEASHLFKLAAGSEKRNNAGADPEKSAAVLLAQMQDWALKLVMASAAGSGALLLVMLAPVALWRRQYLRQAAKADESNDVAVNYREQAESRARELSRQRTHYAQLQEQLRMLQADVDKKVEERTHHLTQMFIQLEAELNDRKMTERALAQQAQELGRSKDLLEMHVQARNQELQKLQRRYEHILNSAGEGIYGLDLQGRISFVNPAGAKHTGWKVEECGGKTELDLFLGGKSGQTSFFSKSGTPNEAVFYRRDGSSFLVETIRTPILEKEKNVGTVVIFKDITDRKRTEEALARKADELARSNAELEQFAYVASHDLQEPLRKIQAFGDRLKAKVVEAKLEDGRDYLERMQNAAARMQRLINDLLTFSRVISATQPFVPVELAVVTKEVLTDLEVRIEQTKAKIEVRNLPAIEADPLQMRQLLQNLIGNALKFQPPNKQPVISIEAKIQPGPLATEASPLPYEEVCELTVRDNGIGFEEQYSEKIFAMFQRLHGRSEYEGTGVGLAVCRRITDRHCGAISAQSKLGEGATFIVRLPVRHKMKTVEYT
jgi:PAS domain S-box-containing protein